MGTAFLSMFSDLEEHIQKLVEEKKQAAANREGLHKEKQSTENQYERAEKEHKGLNQTYEDLNLQANDAFETESKFLEKFNQARFATFTPKYFLRRILGKHHDQRAHVMGAYKRWKQAEKRYQHIDGQKQEAFDAYLQFFETVRDTSSRRHEASLASIIADRNDRDLHGQIKRKKHTLGIVNALKDQEYGNDPGKHNVAYYFVKGFGEGNLVESPEPALIRPCSNCDLDLPLLMWYSQTEDSWGGDTWEKQAFVLCPEDHQITNYEHFQRGMRF